MEIFKGEDLTEQLDRHESEGTVSASSTSTDSEDLPEEIRLKAQEYVSQFETEQTIHLSNGQLKRIILLQQVKALDLLNKKLEQETDTNSNTVLFNKRPGIVTLPSMPTTPVSWLLQNTPKQSSIDCAVVSNLVTST